MHASEFTIQFSDFQDAVRLPVFERRMMKFHNFRNPVDSQIFVRLVDAPAFWGWARHPWHSAWGAAGVAIPFFELFFEFPIFEMLFISQFSDFRCAVHFSDFQCAVGTSIFLMVTTQPRISYARVAQCCPRWLRGPARAAVGPLRVVIVRRFVYYHILFVINVFPCKFCIY